MLLLDTHTFIWLCMRRDLLPVKLLQLMDDESDGLFISSITATEIGLLVSRGKVSIPRSCKEFLDENLACFGIHEVPIDVEIALASTQLPPIHRDPFDRIIIATAQKFGMTILTKDRTIPTYPKVKAVWE
ncbi:type II toxin-antitoxin system VapC family toxin [Pontiella sulfatireligans]|uniref:Ribonuclease VapC22 n=1 Tax=Pontiella sulfatireligans TaxID=2750658 RepID=A0A6C2UJN6_9BACT|nr:type II toxin-antitoxin system VapC family toxin [Pontiella sulfatireligans]VGO20093.1 Ribonuclease VapC22 [Pontiella sulfatireligans]